MPAPEAPRATDVPRGAAPSSAVVAGLVERGFAAETALLAFQGERRLQWCLPGGGARAALVYVQAVVTVVTLLWFAVVTG